MSRTDPIKASRKIGLHHFAFFRGHLEGIDIAELGDLYLETGNDRVRAKSTLRWLRDEFVAAARRQANPAVARLLRVPLEKLTPEKTGTPVPAAAAMTLEDFQAERDPEGFYTEAELIALFEEERHAGDPVAARKLARTDRLRRKLREAILWLENFLSETPLDPDPVAAWLDENLAERLVAAGIPTIGDLTATIRKRGKHWHRNIPKLGPVGGRRLHQWLIKNHLLPNATLPVSTTKPAKLTVVSTLAPLERFQPPVDLSGAVGPNRSYAPGLTATNDWEVINAWLSTYGTRSHTIRSYRKEAERFLLWMIFERQKPMSAATTEDCVSYRNFLNALSGKDAVTGKEIPWIWTLPPEYWKGKRSVPRHSEDWRPFVGELNVASQRLAISVLTGLFEWLMRQRYIIVNPWENVRPANDIKPKIRADHSLTEDQWTAVLDACDELPDGEAKDRLRFILLLGYGMGFRLDEINNIKVAKRQEDRGKINPGLKWAEIGWVIEVLGKRLKLRALPVPAMIYDAMIAYTGHRGFSADPGTWPEQEPLIATLPEGEQYVVKGAKRKALSRSQLYRLLKTHFQRAARKMERAIDAGHLMQASTHWLRHTHATHALKFGAAIQVVQENLGHASTDTTAIYTHAGDDEKKAVIEKMMVLGCKPRQ